MILDKRQCFHQVHLLRGARSSPKAHLFPWPNLLPIHSLIWPMCISPRGNMIFSLIPSSPQGIVFTSSHIHSSTPFPPEGIIFFLSHILSQPHLLPKKLCSSQAHLHPRATSSPGHIFTLIQYLLPRPHPHLDPIFTLRQQGLDPLPSPNFFSRNNILL